MRRTSLTIGLLLALGAGRPSLAQWYTDPVGAERTLPYSSEGYLYADSTGGAYFMVPLNIAQPYLMHVTQQGEWNLAFPGLSLGGFGTMGAPAAINSRNDMVCPIWHDYRYVGGPQEPPHLVSTGPAGTILWEVAFPDTFTYDGPLMCGANGTTIMVILCSTVIHHCQYQCIQVFDSSGNPQLGWRERSLSRMNMDGTGLVSDGAGGALYAWFQPADSVECGSTLVPYEMRLQRIRPNGDAVFPEPGIVVDTMGSESRPYGEFYPSFPGSVIASSRVMTDVRWVRIDSTGAALWDVHSRPEWPRFSTILPDRHGGLFLLGAITGYLSRITSEGAVAFDPIVLPESFHVSDSHRWKVSESTGLNLMWYEDSTNRWFLQRWDTTGATQWAEPMLVLNHPRYYPDLGGEFDMVCDAEGGTIMCFDLDRGSSDQWGWRFTRVDARGVLGSSAGLGIGEETPRVPVDLSLSQNYPNPFNAATRIRFGLSREGRTSLIVYNLTGQIVSTLVDGKMTAGSHEVIFDAVGIPSGVYFYRLQSGAVNRTAKMVVMK